jgi:hypothetical protein
MFPLLSSIFSSISCLLLKQIGFPPLIIAIIAPRVPTHYRNVLSLLSLAAVLRLKWQLMFL